ncbi:MAG TPA: SDR family oxidoreductase [Polyangiaceae bacterium]|nr:SDR family oxidoreductase [Polyangiaceae bacterium]
MTVFVTGASSGFGEAITRKLAAQGDRVVAAGRRFDRLERLAHELGPNVHPLQLDVQNRTAVMNALANLPEAFADVNALVNNAGLALGLEPAAAANLDDWETMVDTNIKGLMFCTRALLPGMIARRRGHIVNMGSIASEFPYPGGNAYGATKAFVHQFSLNLRADLLGTGVRVTNVEPGLCGGSEFSEVRFHGDRERAAAVYRDTQPLTPEDIADTVLWVLSRPAHVNVNVIQLMPVDQAFGPLAVHRRSKT